MQKLFCGDATIEPDLEKIESDCARKINHTSVKIHEGWTYAAWLTEDEWVFVKMKYL